VIITDIFIDLPSEETEREKSIWDGLIALMGGGSQKGSGSGVEIMVVEAETVFKRLTDGFKSAGLNNVISLMVDDDVMFVDNDAEQDDLDLAVSQVIHSGRLREALSDIRIVLETRWEGLHIVLDLEIQTSVVLGREEVHLELVGRVEELHIQVGETARDFDKRVREFTQDYSRIEGYRTAMTTFADRVKQALASQLPDCPIRRSKVYLQVLALQNAQLATLRHLKFGDQVVPPAYRPSPLIERKGLFADRFLYFYYDPYYNYLNWIVLDSLVQDGAWKSPLVRIVEPGGVVVGTGDKLGGDEAPFQAPKDLVIFDVDGNLVVSERVPLLDLPGDPFEDASRWTPEDRTTWT